MTPITEPESIGDILKKKQHEPIKAPAYKWQDLALRLIDELEVPNFKRSAVFKVAKQYPQPIIEKALNDTKELVTEGEKWKYFFKILANLETKSS